MILLGVASIFLTIYIGYRVSASDKKLFSVSLLALFAGLLFEGFRVTDSWKTVAAIFIGSYFFSLFNFLPGKNEHHYVFENHIASWPYVFICIFALVFAIVHSDRVTAKLTEGITLLQSMALIYWTVDYGFVNDFNGFTGTLAAIGLLFSLYAIVNALTYLHLSNGARLALSIWSSMIMFIFALDNIIRVFQQPEIEASTYLSEGAYIGIQYFLVGVSAIYIVQNFILLAEYLPSKNGSYWSDLRDNNKRHLDRYSSEQAYVGHAILCILYSVFAYVMNYHFQIIPRHTMIWLVFLTFPMIVDFIDALAGQMSKKR